MHADIAGRARFWPLFLAAVALPLLALLGAGVFSWWRVHAAAETQLRVDVERLHEHALRAFDTQKALLSVLQWRTSGLSWDEIAAAPELTLMLQAMAENAEGTSSIGMVRPDGRVAHISSAPFPPRPVDYSDREYFHHNQQPDPRPFLSAPLIGRFSGRVAFTYTHPRLDASGRPDGGLFWASFRQEGIGEAYARMQRGPHNESALLRTLDGTILASHPPAPPPPADGQAPPRDMAGMGEAAREAIRHPGEVVLVRGASPLDGQTRLYGARLMSGGVPAVVVKGLNPAEPTAAWQHEVAGLAPVAGATALVLVWLTWRVRGATLRETAALAEGRAEAERRAEAESALRQSQRLRVLGEVVAGVAHDFRNTVQALQGGTILIRKAIEANDGVRAVSLLALMAEAAGRGAALTERMLRVAHRDGRGARQATLDPAAALAAAAELLARTLPAGYPLSLDIRREDLPAQVNGERAEFEAAVLNLAVNARDAMPEGGAIVIMLVGEPARAADARQPSELRRDLPHARLSVIDTGIGMDAVTLAKVAEPFFTTKPPGQGTGLGLASVRDFARTAGGALRIESPGPGRGTTVTLWLPEAWTEPAP